MKKVIEVPFTFDRKTYDSWIKFERYASMKDEIDLLLNENLSLVKPRIIIKEALIDSVVDGISIIEGRSFRSSILAWNLERTDCVWAYVISCGREIYERILKEEDPLQQYWLDSLAELAVQFASDYLVTYMEKNIIKEGQGTLSFMNPGSADRDVWDLMDQRPLFDLIGDVDKEIGVTLTESLLMEPSKAISGLYFQSKEGFFSCWVCSQPSCHSRKAPFKKKFKEIGKI